jgi:hypothetical protein
MIKTAFMIYNLKRYSDIIMPCNCSAKRLVEVISLSLFIENLNWKN